MEGTHGPEGERQPRANGVGAALPAVRVDARVAKGPSSREREDASSLEKVLDEATERYCLTLQKQRDAGASEGSLALSWERGRAPPLKRLRWKGVEVSNELQLYAMRVARGEELAPYRGPILDRSSVEFPWGSQVQVRPPRRGLGPWAMLAAGLLAASALLALVMLVSARGWPAGGEGAFAPTTCVSSAVEPRAPTRVEGEASTAFADVEQEPALDASLLREPMLSPVSSAVSAERLTQASESYQRPDPLRPAPSDQKDVDRGGRSMPSVGQSTRTVPFDEEAALLLVEEATRPPAASQGVSASTAGDGTPSLEGGALLVEAPPF